MDTELYLSGKRSAVLSMFNLRSVAAYVLLPGAKTSHEDSFFLFVSLLEEKPCSFLNGMIYGVCPKKATNDLKCVIDYKPVCGLKV